MSQAYATAGGSPNDRGAQTCTIRQKSCTVSSLQAAITDLLRKHNPHKTWAFLADVFGIKERSAKSRLSNSVAYTIEELQALIQSENGLEYFEALMADAEPQWWMWARWVIEQGTLKRLAVEATQKSLQLESHLPITPARGRGNPDVKKLNAELSRSQTAVGLLDSFSHRASSGAMASTKAQAGRSVGGRGR